ncbi:MAG: DUF3604 domain-containing protein, partial [Bacteroidota bacterium]
MKSIKPLLWLMLAICMLACQSKDASETPSDNYNQGNLPGRTAGYNEDRNAYFGDLHVHTSWSFDAFIYNVRSSPKDAYNFGKGKPIPHFVAYKIQLQRPLDFMAVTDHSEYMGILMRMRMPMYSE